MTTSAQQSLAILRDTSHFGWYMVPLFLLVVYVYCREVEAGRWSRVLAALALLGMDLFNEIWNGLVFHFTQYAPIWGIGHQTSWLLLMGLTIEIALNFAVMGLAATMMLPRDRALRWLGINNRLWFAVINSLLCVAFEVFLNHIGMLVWEWPFWNARQPWLIFLIGYLPFFLVCYWVYDMPSRRRQLAVVAGLLSLDALALAILIPLGWL